MILHALNLTFTAKSYSSDYDGGLSQEAYNIYHLIKALKKWGAVNYTLGHYEPQAEDNCCAQFFYLIGWVLSCAIGRSPLGSCCSDISLSLFCWTWTFHGQGLFIL